MSEHACALCHIGLENVSVVRGGQTLPMMCRCIFTAAADGAHRADGAGKTTLIRALRASFPTGERSAI
jgi:ABC-type molybdenum transport system ATPase subunit/photorepair protein PhrA